MSDVMALNRKAQGRTNPTWCTCVADTGQREPQVKGNEETGEEKGIAVLKIPYSRWVIPVK